MGKRLQTVPMQEGDNLEQEKVAVIAEIVTLAKTEGAGANARSNLAVKCVEWAHSNLFSSAISKDPNVRDDAYTIYDTYIENVKDAASPFGGIKTSKTADGGRRQNATKFRAFLKLGEQKLFDPIGLIHRAQGVVKKARLEGTVRLGPFESLYNIAANQNAQPKDELTDDEMISVCLPKEKGDISEADSLFAIDKTLAAHERRFGYKSETTEM